MKETHYDNKEKDILFSKAIKAGKRIYYVDVKQSSRGDMYLSLTESKRIVSGDAEMPQYSYEKHKVFVYPEDFEKFTGALADAMRFIYEQQGPAEPRPAEERGDIQLDEIEF
ncbi:MAG: PUR family DNA/RNA-binding protein [Bacteroidales bacterium]|nr:PUR family DNA/RNA-binding protein [Bacteroidales bacterium]